MNILYTIIYLFIARGAKIPKIHFFNTVRIWLPDKLYIHDMRGKVHSRMSRADREIEIGRQNGSIYSYARNLVVGRFSVKFMNIIL